MDGLCEGKIDFQSVQVPRLQQLGLTCEKSFDACLGVSAYETNSRFALDLSLAIT